MSEEDMNYLINGETYTKVLYYTRKFVLKNSGTLDDADDVFQDAAIIFSKKSLNGEINSETDAVSQFCQMVRNTWNNELRKRRKRKLIYDLPEDIEDTGDSELSLKKEEEVLILLMEEKISKMKENCREILQSRLNGESFKSLSKRFKIKDIRNMWVRYHRCKNKLFMQISKNKNMAKKLNDLLNNG